MGLEQLKALAVMVVVRIDVGVQRAGVDEQGYRATSSRRISSIRTETSCEPLLPAAEAISLRRSGPPPRCASIASRVSSDTVEPLRSASWRSRASRSSESFTVVRFMYASIPITASQYLRSTNLTICASRRRRHQEPAPSRSPFPQHPLPRMRAPVNVLVAFGVPTGRAVDSFLPNRCAPGRESHHRSVAVLLGSRDSRVTRTVDCPTTDDFWLAAPSKL
jgi:hypothetical protein